MHQWDNNWHTFRYGLLTKSHCFGTTTEEMWYGVATELYLYGLITNLNTMGWHGGKTLWTNNQFNIAMVYQPAHHVFGLKQHDVIYFIVITRFEIRSMCLFWPKLILSAVRVQVWIKKTSMPVFNFNTGSMLASMLLEQVLHAIRWGRSYWHWNQASGLELACKCMYVCKPLMIGFHGVRICNRKVQGSCLDHPPCANPNLAARMRDWIVRSHTGTR